MWLVHVLAICGVILIIWLVVDHIKNPNSGCDGGC